jgi:diacylglycerol kinase (ATP)
MGDEKVSAGKGPKHGIASAFGFAFSGLWYLLRTQRNARIEIAIGAGACGLGVWLGISREQWAIIAITIAIVLIVEGLNTAIEAAVDLTSPQSHPLAKIAKDLAAGMVLIAAILALAVGTFIFGPLVWQRLVK